jgi:hypothetical protein
MSHIEHLVSDWISYFQSGNRHETLEDWENVIAAAEQQMLKSLERLKADGIEAVCSMCGARKVGGAWSQDCEPHP